MTTLKNDSERGDPVDLDQIVNPPDLTPEDESILDEVWDHVDD